MDFTQYKVLKNGEVTPELAHKIGVKLANELWGDRFQVIVTTHLNTNHIHNHFVINAVSFTDGKKYYDNHYTYALMREKSDELCEEYGLEKLNNRVGRKSKIDYENFYKQYSQNDNYSARAKQDIDFAIRQAFSYKDFFQIMNKLGYEIHERANKISICYKDYKRNIRIERRFGEEYSIYNIKQRILNEDATRVPFIEEEGHQNKKKLYKPKQNKRKIKVKGFMAIYFHYMYLLKLYPKKRYKRLSPEMIAEIRKMDIYSKEANFLATNNIKTNDDLEGIYDNKLNAIKHETAIRDNLWKERKKQTNDDTKKLICNKIAMQNKKIEQIREEVSLCEDIKTRIPQMKNQMKELEEKEKQEELDKQKKLEERKQKNRKREF